MNILQYLIHNSNIYEKNSLLKNSQAVYPDFTTIFEGNRYPYSSGIFLPTLYQFLQVTHKTGVIRLSEFVTWAIWGNKALSTNNPSRSKTVVEPTLHPFMVQHFPLTKIFEEIAMLFKFITLGKKRLKITVHARNEQEARNKLICSHAVLFARINTKGGLYA